MSPVLSPAQQRMWLLDRLGQSAYLANRTHELRGPLDFDALCAAVRLVATRHEVLRCRVVTVGGEPRPVFDPPDSVVVERIDLTSSPERAEAVVRELIDRPCDLSTGPLLRAVVLDLSPEHHLFHYSVHHLVFDGLSRVVFEDEVSRAYRDLSVELPPVSPSYAEFAQRQQDDEDIAFQCEYWHDQLSGAPTALELPSDRRRPVEPSSRADRITFSLPAKTVDLLAELATRERTSPFVVALAAYQLLLGQCAGTDDVLVGVPVAGRPDADLERLIGCFAGPAVIRAQLSAPTFADLVGQVRNTVLDALDNQEAPFERIVESLGVDRDASRNPVFQHWFDLVSGELADSGLQLSGLRCTAVEVPETTVRFDTETQLRADVGTLVYSVELFDRATMERFVQRYLHLLGALLSDPDGPLWIVSVVDDRERAELLDLGRAPSSGSDSTVAARFDYWAKATPDAVAVRAGTASLTYHQLWERSSGLAMSLRDKGIGRGSVVGVRLPRGIDLVTALLAVIKAGAAYLPLDVDLPAARVESLTADAGAELVITSIDVSGYGECPGPSRDDLVYVVYTSGSTGAPKGVALDHAALDNLVRWHLDRYRIGPGDRIGQLASISFDAAGWEIWPALCAGAELDVCPDEVVRSPHDLAVWLGASGITGTFAPTPLAEQLLTESLAGLRFLLTGGDVFRPRAGDDPGVPVINHYGPTENAVVATATGELRSPWADNSIGRPIDGVHAYVLDSGLRLAPRGAVGELCLGGASVARGYLGRPGPTAERFVPDPFAPEPGRRMYRTGDLVRWRSDGTLAFVGRIDAQVKVRGYRIEPAEVEAALLTHPGVREVAVTAQPTPSGQAVLAAYLVPNGPALDEDALREHLRSILPSYLVPQAFVVLDELPLTITGKLDRARLPALDLSHGYTAPRTDPERILCEMFASLLGVERVSVEDNFFALGGNSMSAARLVTRVRDAFAVDVPLRSVFDSPTPAGLAADVEAAVLAEIAGMDPDQIAAELAREWLGPVL